MAQKTIVQLIDDLDNSTADETVTFGLDGAQYEIDLSKKNADQLRDVLASYVANARRASRSGHTRPPVQTRRTRQARGDREQLQAIRTWARKNGHKIGDKGRIPSHIMDAYNSQQ